MILSQELCGLILIDLALFMPTSALRSLAVVLASRRFAGWLNRWLGIDEDGRFGS